VAAALLALMPGRAQAGGFSVARFGGEHGHAATTDVTAAFYNPAGLAYERGHRGYLEGLLAYRTVDYTRDPGAIDNPGTGTPDNAVNSGTATLGNLVASPFLGLASDLGVPGLGVALAVYAPFGGSSSWDADDRFAGNTMYPGAVDGPARWSSIEGEQRSLYYTLAAGYRIPAARLAIGVGVNVVSTDINLIRARRIDGTDDVVDAGGNVAEGRSLLELSDTSLSLSAGLMYEPTPCSRVGISYQASPGLGEMTVDGTLTNKFGATPAQAPVDVQMRQTLPDVVRVGGTWNAFWRASLHAVVEWQRWSKFERQCLVDRNFAGARCDFNADGSLAAGADGVLVNIPRDWQDTFGVKLGGTYDLTDTLELNGGVLYDSNAVPDATLEPALIDQDKIITQLGARWQSGRWLASSTLGLATYLERTTAPRTADPMTPSRNPDMAGTYQQRTMYFMLGLGASL
jgi:long-chain fatty acid transport protein